MRSNSSAGAEPTGDGDDRSALQVSDTLSIPRAEITMRVSRSSGAGGQHVNKTSSRVELVWRPEISGAGSIEQRELILTRLASRISADGGLSVVASETRSQLRNREAAERKLAELIASALVVPKRRRPTKPTRAAREERLAVKKIRSRKKRERGDKDFE